ncbi:MAG: RsmD family RNA methyltransferase [Chitinophagaceae bacterium]|nr:RsmD family RNA methyltransferase [Chitinophagaceae bacterium]
MIEYIRPAFDPEIALTAEELKFLSDHAGEDPKVLSLHSGIKDAEQRLRLLHQFSSRKKLEDKIPALLKHVQFIIPPGISAEQSSSERTAAYKSSLFRGKRMIDLTAGMGVDAFYLSQGFEEIILIEAQEGLRKILAHNYHVFQRPAVRIAKDMDAETFVTQYAEKADLIYLDPARRDVAGGKVVKLSDCSPDVVSLLPKLFAISNRVVLKTSPLLDITQACEQLGHVKNVYVVAVDQECKELIFHLEADAPSTYQIHAVQLGHQTGEAFSFYPEEEKAAVLNIGAPQKYVYEAHAALMKAGPYKLLSERLNMPQLHQHTHLYTSEKWMENFPGRSFEIIDVIDADKKAIHSILKDKKANLSIRNFPSTVKELRNKWGLLEGGDVYLFACTFDDERKGVVVAKKGGVFSD